MRRRSLAQHLSFTPSAFSLMLLLCFHSTGFAQDPDDSLALLYGDEETVSIATGTKKPLRLAPSVASVITAEDIKAMGAQSLDEVLAAVPGVHVSLSSRYSSLISVRGIHTNLNPHVLLLIDGFPITELFTGGRIPNFRMPVQGIERVEVIRGPGSAIYGADAFAGVINVITKAPGEMPDLEMGLGFGSFDTHSGWLQASTDWAGWNLGVTVEHLGSDGDQDRIIERDLQSDLDKVFGSNASLAPGPAATNYEILNTRVRLTRKHWSVGLDSWKQDETGIGPGIADTLDDRGYQDGEQHLFELSYDSDDLLDNWQLSGRYNYLYSKQQSHFTMFPPGTILPIGPDGNVHFTDTAPVNLVEFTDGLLGNPGGKDINNALELVAFYNGISAHRIRVSGGYKTQKLETFETKNFGPGVIDGTDPEIDGTLTDVTGTEFIYMPDRKRNITHLSVQDEWALYNDWELTTGVRYDSYSDFGDTINPRIALVWQTSYKLTSKLLYGRAFRAPSFSEQFAINNPVILGNPEVDPEQIDTVELSFEYRFSYDMNMRLNLFQYDVQGLIDYVDDDGLPGGGSTAQNVHDQEGYGFELEAQWDISQDISIAGNYSWQHSENSTTERSIADAPRQFAYLDARWQLSPKWTVSAQVNHVADRRRSMGDLRDDIADYSLMNVNIHSKQLLPFFDVRFSVRNLLSEEAREPSLGPTPGISNDHPLEGRRYMMEMVFRFP